MNEFKPISLTGSDHRASLLINGSTKPVHSSTSSRNLCRGLFISQTRERSAGALRDDEIFIWRTAAAARPPPIAVGPVKIPVAVRRRAAYERDNSQASELTLRSAGARAVACNRCAGRLAARFNYEDTPNLRNNPAACSSLKRSISTRSTADHYILLWRNSCGGDAADGRPLRTLCSLSDECHTRFAANLLSRCCGRHRPNADFHKIDIFQFTAAALRVGGVRGVHATSVLCGVDLCRTGRHAQATPALRAPPKINNQ
ncbi:hypothetical protein EVAR_70742_1 [Eumeta japonica]|uniref:Uncharacterized protein n=1 Tax=Eumeta variegata TaxID=151549 RepID=A0A4C2AG02_EUMVA|nr:hypothetical protein EVAR_70742_1 [Eumeta japonica]